jgi:hypothetical protein
MTEETHTTITPATASRRAVLTGIAAVPLAAVPFASPAMATAGDDAELIAMGEEFVRLHRESKAIQGQMEPLSADAYRRLDMTRPDALKVTDTDRRLFGRGPASGWWSWEHIDLLDSQFLPAPEAVKARREQLATVWFNHYQRDGEAVRREIGYSGLLEQCCALDEAKDEIGDRIMATPTRTVRGLSVKAIVVASWPFEGLPEALGGRKGHDYEAELLASLLLSIGEAVNGEPYTPARLRG